MSKKDSPARQSAFRFIVLMGVVSLFGDITYEGARSIAGPFLATLGAGAAAVGLVTGIGEFIGYTLRLLSGYLSDRTGKYWFLTIIGYALLFSIPLLALTEYWPMAALLIILERVGKGVRAPARDALLSYATSQTGRGLGFGVHEALDQIGAIFGPMMFTVVFFLHGTYQQGFSLLWFPALLCMMTLWLARKKVPHPDRLEKGDMVNKRGFSEDLENPGSLYLYMVFTFFTVGGLVNFQILAYHFKIRSVLSEAHISLFYAAAMGMDALMALMSGKSYDRFGLTVLWAAPLLSLPIPFLAFHHRYAFVLAAVLLWGAALGIHEAIMRAAIADMVPVGRRGMAFGIFNTVYGMGWFVGSTVAGVLYDIHREYLTFFVVSMELMAAFIF
ncbi:MAG: MFS transporter, partial [Calditrichaeota bacterium]